MAQRSNPNGLHGQPPRKKQRLQPNQNGHRPQQQQQRQAQPSKKQPFHRFLEISQINVLARPVYDWIYGQCALSENIEIEAKLGKFLTFKDPTDTSADEQKQGNDEIRVHEKMGLKSLAWIDLFKNDGRFESTVSDAVFISLNKKFNDWYANCMAAPHQRLPMLQHFEFPDMTYKRSRTVDKIYKFDR